jgi:hypothetical protein
MHKESQRDKLLDEEFIKCTLLIHTNYASMSKHLKVRVDKWLDKLVHITSGESWKQNRNLYTKYLLHCIITNNFTGPFTKLPDDLELQTLNKSILRGRLSERVEQLISEQDIPDFMIHKDQPMGGNPNMTDFQNQNNENQITEEYEDSDEEEIELDQYMNRQNTNLQSPKSQLAMNSGI